MNILKLGSLLFLFSCGGSAAQRTLNSVEIAEWVLPYNHALDACRIEAKKQAKGQQFDAYDKCEKEETRKLCEKNPRFKAAWAQCMEVIQ